MVPVTFPANRAAGDGLRAGEHYLAGADDPAPFDMVSRAAHAWYCANTGWKSTRATFTD